MSPLPGIYASQISGHTFVPSGAYDALASVTIPAGQTATSIVFAGIPSGYKHLQIRAFVTPGITGSQGATGTQGLQGLQGLQGTTGAQGLTGSQGAQGTQGIQGTVGNAGGGISGFNAQTGTTYTLVIGDLNKLVTASNASAITVTVPPSVFSANDVVNLQQIGAGQVTFAQGSGVTITSNGGTSTAPKLRTQFSACSIICTASNTFTIIGDLS